MKKAINYAESGSDEEDEDTFKPAPASKTRGRALKRRKTNPLDDEDEFPMESEDEFGSIDEGEGINFRAVRMELTDHVQMTSSYQTIRKKRFHDLRSGSGPQHLNQYHTARHLLRYPITTTL